MTESSPRSVSTAPGRPHTIITTAFTKLLIGQVLCHYLRASPAWSSYEYLTYSSLTAIHRPAHGADASFARLDHRRTAGAPTPSHRAFSRPRHRQSSHRN